MFYESFRRLIFPAVLIAVVGSLWIVAWSQSLQAQAAMMNSWSALPAPAIENQASNTVNPMLQKPITPAGFSRTR
jgi:hypothetical protein